MTAGGLYIAVDVHKFYHELEHASYIDSQSRLSSANRGDINHLADLFRRPLSKYVCCIFCIPGGFWRQKQTSCKYARFDLFLVANM